MITLQAAKPGDRVGKWTIIERVANKKRHPYFSCLCDCGILRDVAWSSLRRGQSNSCGCGKSNILPKGLAGLRRLLYNYRNNAKKRGLIWDIDEFQIIHLTQQRCHYCGIEPNMRQYGNQINGDYIYNGMDRVDNDIGYTLDNVVPCCKQCNKMKSDTTRDKFIKHCKEVAKWQT